MSRIEPTAAKDPSAGTLYPGESPRIYRALFNVFPPYLFGGVRVKHIAADWTSVRVDYTVRPWNRNNPNRAAFGGTLYSMTDPFFAIMAYGQLGRGTVTTTMGLSREQVAEIRQATESGAKSITEHSAEIVDGNGTLVARAAQQLYVRRLPD
ncbi:PaaI family thioesterase [Nocardia rhizosphaerihabitans]|uniref:PaaI family thioesterase n=1 Tax=Nocardia rhizosphaerihabitans TaxID=1691570 RepID=UPI00366FDB02